MRQFVDGDDATVGSLPGQIRPAQFSLATLLLVMTLIAVCLGVLRLNPCLGFALVLLATPALVRTMYLASTEQARGHRLSLREKVTAFFASIGVVILACVAGCVALVMGCAFTGAVASGIAPGGEPLLIGLLIVSVVVAIAAGAWVVWALGPRRR